MQVWATVKSFLYHRKSAASSIGKTLEQLLLFYQHSLQLTRFIQIWPTEGASILETVGRE